jgi:hypothetical protein
MMETTLEGPGTPRVLGIYSFRFDAHLVPALRANTRPFVDGWISWDDRGAQGPFGDETERRYALLNAARDAGAEWVLTLDPDERIESRFRLGYRRALASRANVVTFALRELYSPREYRTDGVWGTKRQPRLLRVRDGIVRPDSAVGSLHVQWTSFLPAPQVLESRFNVYHLKMIDPERRRGRAALYRHLDPDLRMQAIGYDYLADEAGMALRRIPLGRGYRPRHTDDGGLWMDPSVAEYPGPTP